MIQHTPESLETLRSALSGASEVISFRENPKLASEISAIALQREVGTQNDELSWHLYDARTGLPIESSRPRADLIRVSGVIGVRIEVPGVEELEIRKTGILPLLHPSLSFGENGALKQLVIFPESVARILALQGVEAVVVRSWAINTLFGGYDPSANFYEVNEWELKNNDALFFARLVERRRQAFQGSHDLASHIAGTQRENWNFLSQLAGRVANVIETSLHHSSPEGLGARVIPYLLGVLLDDLAQPTHAAEPGRIRMIQEGLKIMSTTHLARLSHGTLIQFPLLFSEVLKLGRSESVAKIETEAHSAFASLLQEIRANSVSISA